MNPVVKLKMEAKATKRSVDFVFHLTSNHGVHQRINLR